MKKVFIPLLILLVAPIASCNSNNKESGKVYISYGSLYDEKATAITREELNAKVANEESFLLAMSPGDESTVTCSCWRTFSSIVDSFVKNNTPIVYKCDVYFAEKYGVVPPENQDPGFAIFKDGKLYKQYVYTTKNTPTYFTNKDAFVDFIKENTVEPKMVYINDDQYKDIIQEEGKNAISIVRKGCSDCGYMLPNVIDPFFKENQKGKTLYLLDIEALGHYNTSTPEDKAIYEEYKDSLYLSETANEEFGYQKGVVPTTFIFEANKVIDANVFFNDEVSKKENGTYYISNSYYSEERVSSLKYTDQVLVGKELSEDEIMTYNEFVFMPSTSAAVYHTPILNSFLNYYLK